MHSSYRAQVRKAIVRSGVPASHVSFEERAPGQSTPTGIRNHNGALVVRISDEPTLHFSILHSGNEWLCTFSNTDAMTQSRRRIFVADGAFPDLVLLLEEWLGRATVQTPLVAPTGELLAVK